VDADHAHVLQEHAVAGDLRDASAREPDDEQPAFERDAASRAVEDVAADRIEDHIGAFTVRLAAYPLDPRLGPVVDTDVGTGLAVAIPPGFAGLVLPRSGLALSQGVTVLNAPGLVDAGYRGELKVLLVNHGDQPVAVRRGDRIAQLVIQSVERADLIEVGELPASERGAGGFGSTGV